MERCGRYRLLRGPNCLSGRWTEQFLQFIYSSMKTRANQFPKHSRTDECTPSGTRCELPDILIFYLINRILLVKSNLIQSLREIGILCPWLHIANLFQDCLRPSLHPLLINPLPARFQSQCRTSSGDHSTKNPPGCSKRCHRSHSSPSGARNQCSTTNHGKSDCQFSRGGKRIISIDEIGDPLLHPSQGRFAIRLKPDAIMLTSHGYLLLGPKPRKYLRQLRIARTALPGVGQHRLLELHKFCIVVPPICGQFRIGHAPVVFSIFSDAAKKLPYPGQRGVFLEVHAQIFRPLACQFLLELRYPGNTRLSGFPLLYTILRCRRQYFWIFNYFGSLRANFGQSIDFYFRFDALRIKYGSCSFGSDFGKAINGLLF